MGLGLADAGMGAHGRSDQKAVGGVGDESLIGGGIVGRVEKAHPGVELGWADQLGIADVDVVDDEDLPDALAAHRAPGLLGRGHGARRVGMTDDVGLIGTEEHEGPGDQRVTLADGHRAAGHGTPAVHALDCNVEGGFGVGTPGEDGVDRLDRLALLTGQPRHHGLRQQLPAEDDAVRGAEAARPIAVGADLFERQRLDERSNREHDPPLEPGEPPLFHDRFGSCRSCLRSRSARVLSVGRPDLTVVFDGDVKVRYPPEERPPRHKSRAVAGRCPPSRPGWIRTTRGTAPCLSQ